MFYKVVEILFVCGTGFVCYLFIAIKGKEEELKKRVVILLPVLLLCILTGGIEIYGSLYNKKDICHKEIYEHIIMSSRFEYFVKEGQTEEVSLRLMKLNTITEEIERSDLTFDEVDLKVKLLKPFFGSKSNSCKDAVVVIEEEIVKGCKVFKIKGVKKGVTLMKFYCDLDCEYVFVYVA